MTGFCEQCGAALGEGAKFCAACGTEVGANTAPTAAELPTPEPATAEAPYSPPPPKPAAASDPTQPTSAAPPAEAAADPSAPPLPPAAAAPTRRRRKRWPYVVVGVILLVIIIAVAGGHSNTKNPAKSTAGTGSSTPAPAKPAMPQTEKDARAWIKNLGFDSDKVQANVSDVQIALGFAIKKATVANVDKLAQSAQQAHDNLDSFRQDFASTNEDNGPLGNAELSAFSGANDLKNSMGALVTYTGSPNAATLASFTTQYQKARAEWNYGVRTIWRIAHRQHPPTV